MPHGAWWNPDVWLSQPSSSHVRIWRRRMRVAVVCVCPFAVHLYKHTRRAYLIGRCPSSCAVVVKQWVTETTLASNQQAEARSRTHIPPFVLFLCFTFSLENNKTQRERGTPPHFDGYLVSRCRRRSLPIHDDDQERRLYNVRFIVWHTVSARRSILYKLYNNALCVCVFDGSYFSLFLFFLFIFKGWIACVYSMREWVEHVIDLGVVACACASRPVPVRRWVGGGQFFYLFAKH